MKPQRALYTCLLVLLVFNTVLADGFPSSQRSLLAVDRSGPRLKSRVRAMGLAWGAPLFIRIFKQERHLEVWLKDRDRFTLFARYSICTFGGKGIGPKTTCGDGRAPEGFYTVGPRQLNPHSRYHLAFNIGYPNAYDRAHGHTGSALMVHGGCVSIGCFAMTDTGIEEIYVLADAALRNGQPFFQVHIFPCRMTDADMRRLSGSKWRFFWKNLKRGHDLFEVGNLPPEVGVSNKVYRFKSAAPDL